MIMNRSFFIMFFMYFFVVQSAIFGVVRWEPKFYLISIVNLIFIILMALFYKNFDTSPAMGGTKKDLFEETKAEHIVHKYHVTLHASRKNNSSLISYLFVISIILLFLVVLDKAFLNIFPVSVWRFAWFYFIILFLSAKKLLDKKIVIWNTVFLPKDFLFWTSLIVVIGVYGTLVLQVLAFKLLFAALIWFIFFFIGATIVKELWSSNIFKLFFTRFYLVLIAIFALILWVQSFSSSYKYKLANDRGAIQSLFTHGFSFHRIQQVWMEDVFTWPDLLSNGTWQVLSTSLSTWIVGDTYSDVILTGDVSSDVLFSKDATVSSTIDAWTVEPEEDDRLNVPLYPTLMDTLIYLMDHYGVELSSQKNMIFTYVSPKNPYYAQFKTAYDMKLIGYSANPSKRVLCETYMVMKWLVGGRSVTSSSDIKSAYWSEATKKWVLNWCKRNFYVKNTNL